MTISKVLLSDIHPTQFRLEIKSFPWTSSTLFEGSYRYLQDALEDLHSKGYELKQVTKAERVNPRGEWELYTNSQLKGLVDEITQMNNPDCHS